MAKQLYIDENGNPIEVSGTINTAELLPISGNDPTDTKNYIDTGLNGKVKVAYKNDNSVSVYNVPLTDLQTASGREYGMALVFAWKEIFAIFYNNDSTVYAVSLTSHGDRTLSISYSSGNIVLTFSANIWGGIAIIAV